MASGRKLKQCQPAQPGENQEGAEQQQQLAELWANVCLPNCGHYSEMHEIAKLAAERHSLSGEHRAMQGPRLHLGSIWKSTDDGQRTADSGHNCMKAWP